MDSENGACSGSHRRNNGFWRSIPSQRIAVYWHWNCPGAQYSRSARNYCKCRKYDLISGRKLECGYCCIECCSTVGHCNGVLPPHDFSELCLEFSNERAVRGNPSGVETFQNQFAFARANNWDVDRN